MDLYNSNRRLLGAEAMIKQSVISKEDKELLFGFEKHLLANNTSILRVEKYLRTLRISAETLARPLEQVTKNDIEDFLAYLNRQDLRAWSKRDYVGFLRRFYKWMGKGTLVDNLKPPKGKGRIPNMLSQTEIDTIIRRTPHERDKAMIAGMYDLGCRLGEWFSNLCIGDFAFEDDITEELIEVSKGLYEKKRIKKKIGIVNLFGKTGARPVRIEWSTEYLMDWIKVHPKKNNPKAYMWVNQNGEPLFSSYDEVMSYIRKIVKNAGITKHIVMYSFRHSRMTHLNKELKDTYLMCRHGTSQLSTYIH